MGASSRSAAAAAVAAAADDDSTPNNDACMCSEVTCDKNSGVSVSSLAEVTCARLKRTYSAPSEV